MFQNIFLKESIGQLKNITNNLTQQIHALQKSVILSCIDRLLFNSSTTVTIGNGHKAQFWHHAWLEGEAPRYLAPNLFKLVRRKNRTVHQELLSGNWIRSLRARLLNVQLQDDVQDSIIWKWTADGIYSTRSAYRIQFHGSHRTFQHDLMWKAHAENKCKVHAWILMHSKTLTADNLQKRGWPHQEHYVLCNGPLETGVHLSLLCPFARAV